MRRLVGNAGAQFAGMGVYQHFFGSACDDWPLVNDEYGSPAHLVRPLQSIEHRIWSRQSRSMVSFQYVPNLCSFHPS